jgi:hypothetical protein
MANILAKSSFVTIFETKAELGFAMIFVPDFPF